MIIDINNYTNIAFFTGAGMSAECGVPTYRGSGGIWHQYNWQEYACQSAFNKNPEKVLNFHEIRRKAVSKCQPHEGHRFIAELQNKIENVAIVTQNIDGMHQKIGTKNVIELHGSLWRLRCEDCGIITDDIGERFSRAKCNCGKFLRPDITWFNDMLNMKIINEATDVIEKCDLFVSIGTSGVVWPAAGFPYTAKSNGAYCIEMNPESTELSYLFNEVINCKASVIGKYFRI